jgi:hypothetical protein
MPIDAEPTPENPGEEKITLYCLGEPVDPYRELVLLPSTEENFYEEFQYDQSLLKKADYLQNTVEWQRVDDESASSENSLSDNSTDYGEDADSSTDGSTSMSAMFGVSLYQLGKLLWKNGGEKFIESRLGSGGCNLFRGLFYDPVEELRNAFGRGGDNKVENV